MTLFRDLLRISSQFVEKQKGYWDHNAWLSLLKDAQEKGLQLTSDMQTYLGTIVQSMKRIYETSSFKQGFGKGFSDATKVMYEQTVNFVEQTKGKWDHAGWEGFIKELQQKGINMTEEGRAYLGELLEAAKKFYITLPTRSVEDKPAESENPPSTTAAEVEKPAAPETEPTTVEKKPRVRKTAAPKADSDTKKTTKSPGRKKTVK
ncbi:MAG: hypothetical protein HQK88_09145 [Nitrospirae bacterium]|nr:hypothetical protein [Nitrospirota bacterium]MBF0535662.1 hypothetical protein [Nitrospirota bacterium]MBF0616968.1 hypothetical protein [Nitrospirota bacterium]